MRAWLLCALLLGCSSKEEPRVEQDTGVEEEQQDAAIPQLDPSKCGTVSGDEAPLMLGAAGPATLSEKIFPLFLELESEATRLTGDMQLKELQARVDMRFAEAAACTDAPCVVAKTAWPDADITLAAERTAAALDGTTFVRDRLRPSGRFNAYAEKADRELLVAAVVEHLKAANGAIAAFATEVDAPKLVPAPSSGPFFHRTRALALAILETADRDQAALYEPLDKGENAAAIATIASIDWGKYPFAAIVVPGLGPTDASPLAEGGRVRADMAAARYAAKVAPLIVLSGGHVHPDRTQYSEAIEMKKYLVAKGVVPASAILVDPHARHTTTNLRNASRLLLRYGVPEDRPVDINTDMFQSLYIQGRPFAVRCREEIGYEPWRRLASLSATDTCMIATRRSLHIGPSDPRDP